MTWFVNGTGCRFLQPVPSLKEILKMRTWLFVLPGILLIAFFTGWAGNSKSNSKVACPTSPNDSSLTFETKPAWADEFDYAGLPDSSIWSYDIGGNGWGNHELQYYTNSIRNAEVSGGLLTIKALKEDIGELHYSSARLVTKNKRDILYGRIEVKARIPEGIGTWPAIWMLPTDWLYGGWPSSGEIDIMEHVGYNPDVIHISTHCEAYYWIINNQKTATRKIENATKGFHLYRVDWTPEAIRGYIDDTLLFTNLNEGTGYKAWPFDQKFHLLLNIAVGGDWGGAKGVDDTVFPAVMQVDYIRFYKMIEK